MGFYNFGIIFGMIYEISFLINRSIKEQYLSIYFSLTTRASRKFYCLHHPGILFHLACECVFTLFLISGVIFGSSPFLFLLGAIFKLCRFNRTSLAGQWVQSIGGSLIYLSILII